MAGNGDGRFFQWGPREAAVLPLTLTLEGAMTMGQDPAVGPSWPTTWVLFLPERDRREGRLRGTWLSGLPDLVKVGEKCFRRIFEQSVSKFFERVQDTAQSLEEVFAQVRGDGLSQLPDAGLADAYMRFRAAYVAWWRPNYVVEPLEYFGEARAREIFGDARALSRVAKAPSRTMEADVKRALNTVVDKALLDSRATDALLAQDAFAFAEHAQRDKELGTLVDTFRREYFWLRNNYYSSGSLTFDQACGLVVDHCESLRKDTAEHVEGALESRLRESSRQKMQRVANDDSDASMLIELWDRMAQFKDDRKRTNLFANHHLEHLLREAARRRHVALSDVRNLLPHEVADFIRGGVVATLEDRRRGVVVLWRTGEAALQCLYEPDLAALAHGGIGAQMAQAAARAETGRTIAGTGNGYGTVEGVAHVCETYHDALRIPPGGNAILVTYMTSPEWLGVMSRVHGVVTVEGGQASHAFLSCSQMKKPLIIGAHGAVDPALHGAMVRLDSNGGTLQVLQPAK